METKITIYIFNPQGYSLIRYREYYENGKLRLRGKYSHNQPKGTWKYYTEEGKFERKEKF